MWIKPHGRWKGVDDVEIATAEWIDWFVHRRPYEYCGDIPPAELEAAHTLNTNLKPSVENSQQ